MCSQSMSTTSAFLHGCTPVLCEPPDVHRVRDESRSFLPRTWAQRAVVAPDAVLAGSAIASRHACRSPRVLRTHLHAYARRIYVTVFRTCIGFCIFRPAHPTVPPLPASCSSRQRLASGFLPTLSRPRRRCLPLTLAHVGCVEDFHLQMSAPCRAHRENGGVLADSAITCSSIITYGPRQSAQQLHRSVHPLDPIARVPTNLRAFLNGIPASTRS